MLESPHASREPDLPLADGVEPVVIPERVAGRGRHPAPAEAVLDGEVVVGERSSRLQEHRRRGAAALRDQQSEAVQEHVERSGTGSRRRKRKDGSAHVDELLRTRWTREHRGAAGSEIGLAGQREVECLKSSCRL